MTKRIMNIVGNIMGTIVLVATILALLIGVFKLGGFVTNRANNSYRSIAIEACDEEKAIAEESGVYDDVHLVRKHLLGFTTGYDVVKGNDQNAVLVHVSRDGSVSYEAQ